MKDTIRKAVGATNFEAIITYKDNKTQIPSSYKYIYIIRGTTLVVEFENINPYEYNSSQGLTVVGHSSFGGSSISSGSCFGSSTGSSASKKKRNVSSVDTDGNGEVTIKEAKPASFSMPITSDHWLYKYMKDNDGDGMVGE